VGIIEKGKLLFLGSIDAVRGRREVGHQVTIRLHREDPRAADIVTAHPRVGAVEARGPELVFEYRGEAADFHEVVKLLVDQKVPILTISEASRNLERFFLEVTGGQSS
jgi:ABC-type multidrug transport system ATPase subunit